MIILMHNRIAYSVAIHYLLLVMQPNSTTQIINKMMHSISEMVVSLLDLAMSCFRVCVPVSDQMALTASLPVSDDSPELPDRDAEVQLEEPRQELQRSRRSGFRLFRFLKYFRF